MPQVTRILCPVDLSTPSRRALDIAVGLARWYGSSITVLRVVPPILPTVGVAGELDFSVLPAVTPDLDQVRDATAAFAAHEAGGPPMNVVVVEGDVPGEIVDQARRLPADLIVIGTHGHRGFDRLMLGSVTERVLRRAPCPVLTVPAGAPDAVPAAPGLFKQIVCGVDFSPASRAALRFAASIAKEADAALTVAHVVEHIALWPLPVAAVDADALERRAREDAAAALHEAIDSDVREFARVDEQVLMGKPYQRLLELAAERDADLIVAGAHGGRTARPHFGSTTNHLVRSAACPVLTLRTWE